MSDVQISRRPLARPFFRRALGVTLALLAMYVVWTAWDYVEARRLAAAIETVRARGLFADAPAKSWSYPEYADDVARFYQAAGDLIPSGRVNQRMWYALRDTSGKPMPPERVAEARAILAESAPVFELTSRAQSAPIRKWRNLYGRTPYAFGKVQGLLSFRTWFLARTERVDEAAAALLDEFDVSRAAVGLEDEDGPRYGMSTTMWGRAIELEVILNVGCPSLALLKRLEPQFATDASDDLTFAQWQLRTALAHVMTGRTVDAYTVTEYGVSRLDIFLPFVSILRPFVRHQLTRSVRDLADIADTSRRPWPERLKRLEALAQTEKPSDTPGTAWIAGPRHFRSALESTQLVASSVAAGRSGRIALAVEEYRMSTGRPPASLSELVPTYLDAVPIDPFSGDSLRYRLEAHAYTIYSVGLNGRDDGGDLGAGWRPGVHATPKFSADDGIRVAMR